MAVILTIAGTDRSAYALTDSLRIESVLTQQSDRCNFTIRNSNGYVPTVGNEVIITDNGVRVFGGVIVRRTEGSPAFGTVEYGVECQDYTRALDQHLIAETYEDMTVDDIIADIVANWAPPGFTTVQVDCPVSIDYIQFKYEPVSACLKQLADLTGYNWRVDYFKDIFFKSTLAENASIDIEDDNGSHVNESLVIRRDNSQMRNSIIVRGGEYLGTEFTASVRADGKQITFNLPYKYTDFAATLTGDPLNIGIDYIDNADSYDALYNFNEKLLRFKETDRPNQNATLSFSGRPHLPVIVRVRDNARIADILAAEGQGDGVYEHVIIDKSINTQVAARERAWAEIRTYGQTVSEGEFDTETAGLKPGQRIFIDSVARDINEYFIINRVTSVMKDTNTMIYKVSLITTKTMDFIDFLKKMVLAENKSIVITDDELLNLSDTVAESILFTASTVVQAVDYGVQWVLGPQTPSGFKRVFIVGGGRLS